MRTDKDIAEMSFGERGRELKRIWRLIRTHKRKRDNARCWHNDLQLYEAVLPEGCRGAGRMTLPKEVLLRNCSKYIDRQKCVGCPCQNKIKKKKGARRVAT